MKIYIFDDTLILSGANISHSYLTNRQDRIILFKNNRKLANRFHDIATCIASNSFKVVQGKECASRRCILPSAIFPGKFSSSYLLDPPRFDPLTQPYQFSLNLRNQLEEIFVPTDADKSALIYRRSFPKRLLAHQTYSGGRFSAIVRDNDKSKRSIDWEMGDTWLLPTVQAGFAGVRQEEALTLSILNLIGDNAGDLWITSPYMNFSESYVRAMARLPKETRMTILTSSMEANGFFGSKGLSGQIPLAYAMLEQRFWSRISKCGEQRTLREYSREGHEFHAKGLYWTPQKTDAELMLASLGSSNFGIRSLRRDLECQSILITKNEVLKNKLKEEWKGLIHHSSVINQENLLQRVASNNFKYFGRMAIRAVRGFL
jgi:CDP-diacylglycerol--glycerol-3-phosphate 3-phosphatidyltransferase